MDYINYISFFVFGLVFASFLNALGYRLDKNYKYPSIFVKPSSCERCKKALNWYELIPIVGYLINRGKCSGCHKPINAYYPVSELYLGLTFLILFLTNSPVSFYVLSLILFLLSYFDITTMSIPKNLTDIFLIAALAYKIFMVFINQGFSLADDGALVFALIILLGVVVINKWKEVLGLGDLLILLIISCILPFTSFALYLYITILLSGTTSIILVLVNKEFLKKYIPLLPFMTVAFTLTVWVNYYYPSLLHRIFPILF